MVSLLKNKSASANMEERNVETNINTNLPSKQNTHKKVTLL